jgi:hypothetical protein
MSDPTARRGDNVMALLQAIVNSGRPWKKQEMLSFLFMRYRAGVREETLESIWRQLLDRGIIYGKPISKGANIYVYSVETKRLEQLTGVHLR